jgi:F-type H+-transporting ATPase subunit epsilon
MQVLYGHAPLLTELDAGELSLTGGDAGERKFFVIWGFAEVLPNRVTVLAEKVLSRSEIDVAEARRQLERGKRLWKEAGEDGARYEEANRTIQVAEQILAAAENPEKSA